MVLTYVCLRNKSALTKVQRRAFYGIRKAHNMWFALVHVAYLNILEIRWEQNHTAYFKYCSTASKVAQRIFSQIEKGIRATCSGGVQRETMPNMPMIRVDNCHFCPAILCANKTAWARKWCQMCGVSVGQLFSRCVGNLYCLPYLHRYMPKKISTRYTQMQSVGIITNNKNQGGWKKQAPSGKNHEKKPWKWISYWHRSAEDDWKPQYEKCSIGSFGKENMNKLHISYFTLICSHRALCALNSPLMLRRNSKSVNCTRSAYATWTSYPYISKVVKNERFMSCKKQPAWMQSQKRAADLLS